MVHYPSQRYESDRSTVDKAPVARTHLCHTEGERRQLNAVERNPEAMTNDRFLTLADVAEVLNISASQTYALVRSGELEAIKIGGRGQWRVEREKLESYISRMYDQTKQFVEEHPYVETDADVT
jgi:excisionase family DNA binding protein